MNAKKLMIGIAALLAVAITSLGCYTIIRHPSMTTAEEQASADNSSSYAHGKADRDCLRCHQDYSDYPYGHYYEYYPDYYWSNPNWGSYYAYPWWWEDYWYEDNGNAAVDTVDVVGSPERRRGLAPPYTRGADPLLDPPPFSPGSTTPIVGGSGGTSTGGGTVVTPPTNTDDGKKEEQKPPRRRGK